LLFPLPDVALPVLDLAVETGLPEEEEEEAEAAAGLAVLAAEAASDLGAAEAAAEVVGAEVEGLAGFGALALVLVLALVEVAAPPAVGAGALVELVVDVDGSFFDSDLFFANFDALASLLSLNRSASNSL